MLHAVRHALTRVGESTTHPFAFAVVTAYALAWLVLSPETFGWAAVATLATWLMTLFINRTEHRDTQALHAKLDELLRTQGKARSDLTTLDDHDVKDIEEHRLGCGRYRPFGGRHLCPFSISGVASSASASNLGLDTGVCSKS